MRPTELIRGRPDNTQEIVGREGIPVQQDREGTQVTRIGVAGADADWGPATLDVTNTTKDLANPERVGGTRESSGIVRSKSGSPFSIAYVWISEDVNDDLDGIDSVGDIEDDDGVVVEWLESGGSTVFDGEAIIDRVKTKGDYCSVVVQDESDDAQTNMIEFTLNFH